MKLHPPIIMFLAKAFQTDPRPRQEARSLVKAGYAVSIIAWDRECEFNHLEEVEGTIVHSFRPASLRTSSAIGLALGALIFQIILLVESVKLITQLKQRPFLHAHDFNTLLPACILKTLRLTAGVVYDSHELTYAAYRDFYGPRVGLIARLIEERCLKYPDVVLTVSPLFVQYLHQFNNNVQLIYNCPRTSDIPQLSREKIRNQLGLPPKDFIVSFVGSVNNLFPARLFLQVASLLTNRKEIHFLIVGGGPDALKVKQMAKESNAKLTILPQVSHEKALCYVSASNLTWAIYRGQSLNARMTIPWKLYESLACRVPILAEKGTLTADLVTKLKVGLALDSENIEQISQSILTLSTNPGIQSVMPAQKEYTWENMSLKLTKIYNRLAQAQPEEPRER